MVLNEVLSITAQEFRITPPMNHNELILNEVLSITAQEYPFIVTIKGKETSSMKS